MYNVKDKYSSLVSMIITYLNNITKYLSLI